MIKLGQLLFRQRNRRKLSLEDAAKATKIKASFLAAIEKGDYHKLPSPAYAKGFVINYATYLGLSKAEAVALFNREFDEKRAYKVLPDSLTRETHFPQRRIKIQESLLLVAGLIIIFFGFIFFQYKSAFFAPPLSISSPKEGSTLSRETTIVGKTDSDATVTVNNEPVSLDSDGKFSKKLELFPGKTTITVKAKSRFGKETVVTREALVE
jgi:cytoskeletal protein RodZ